MVQAIWWITRIVMFVVSMVTTPVLAEEPKPINQEQQSQNVTSRIMEGQLPNWHYGGFVDLGYSLDFNFPENHLFRNRSTTPRVNELLHGWGSRDDAAELASEVFAEAWRRVPGLQWRGRPVRAWLYRVAANMAADEVRRRARHGAPLLDEPAVRDDAESVPDRIALARALRALPPDHQLVVHLRLVEGLAFAEVATIMNRSVGACQMTLLRAGKSLRAALAAEGVREHA